MTVQIARVEERFKCPGPQPNGLQAVPDGLWCIDQVDLKIYKFDYESGEVLFEAQTDTAHSSGITLGDGSLWIASTFELKIARLDPATGQTIAKLDSPGNGVVAWVADQQNGRVTGAHGLEWKDGKVYVALAAFAIRSRDGCQHLGRSAFLSRPPASGSTAWLGRTTAPSGSPTPRLAPSTASIPKTGASGRSSASRPPPKSTG